MAMITMIVKSVGVIRPACSAIFSKISSSCKRPDYLQFKKSPLRPEI